MSKQLLIATRNPKKKKELQEILSGFDLQLLNLDDIPPLPEVEEDGLTFEENAIKKALVVARQSNMLTLADDSGLVVDALQGAPGVFSARYAGPEANDDRNNQKLLQAMQQVEDHQRSARFVCVIALASPQGKVETVRGSCAGSISRTLHGGEGFGYDPLFIPEGFDKSFAELTPEIKNRISHRGIALNKIKPLLEASLHMEG